MTIFFFLGARAKPALGQLLGQLVGRAGREPVRLGHVPQGRAVAEAVDGRHHRHPVGAKGLEDMLDDLVAPARAQVGVDIRRGGAGRVEEALEIQVQAQRVGAGDPRQCATSEEAAEPRDEYGTPAWRAKASSSSTIRKIGS